MQQSLATDCSASNCWSRCHNSSGWGWGGGPKPSNHGSSPQQRQGCVPTMTAVLCLHDASCARGWTDSHWPRCKLPHLELEPGITLSVGCQLPGQTHQAVQSGPVSSCQGTTYQLQFGPWHAHTNMARLLTSMPPARVLAVHETVCKHCLLT